MRGAASTHALFWIHMSLFVRPVRTSFEAEVESLVVEDNLSLQSEGREGVLALPPSAQHKPHEHVASDGPTSIALLKNKRQCVVDGRQKTLVGYEASAVVVLPTPLMDYDVWRGAARAHGTLTSARRCPKTCPGSP